MTPIKEKVGVASGLPPVAVAVPKMTPQQKHKYRIQTPKILKLLHGGLPIPKKDFEELTQFCCFTVCCNHHSACLGHGLMKQTESHHLRKARHSIWCHHTRQMLLEMLVKIKNRIADKQPSLNFLFTNDLSHWKEAVEAVWASIKDVYLWRHVRLGGVQGRSRKCVRDYPI